jgi:2-polyprenyl-3-methyl-5-hydroxy-6-metoxy-1,4-benzoquinol methylase
LDPPDVTRARVLEIGCAAAGNLIPLAATHPLARTVGIDLSQVHIHQGRSRVRALGLDNVELMHGDVAHLDLAAVGQFDFIICHGVYSWVPDEMQDAILAACGQLLSPRRCGIRRLQHVSRLEGQGNCARRDAPERRRQRDD